MNATAYGISKTGVSIQVAVKMLKGTVRWNGAHKGAQKWEASSPASSSPRLQQWLPRATLSRLRGDWAGVGVDQVVSIKSKSRMQKSTSSSSGFVRCFQLQY